jgi:hypothetical protein
MVKFSFRNETAYREPVQIGLHDVSFPTHDVSFPTHGANKLKHRFSPYFFHPRQRC